MTTNLDFATYTAMAMGINHLLDEGEHLDPSETLSRIEDGTVLDWLDTSYPNKAFFVTNPADRAKALARFQNILSVYAPRKFGVGKNGLCILMGLCIESIQQVVPAGRDDLDIPASPLTIVVEHP